MKQAILILNLALASVFFAASANGATITWASGNSGNWSNTNNWNPSQIPGFSDTAVITASGNYTVTVNSNITVGGLVLGSGDATTQTIRLDGQFLAIGQSATVHTNGVINLSSGTLDFDPYGGSVISGVLMCSGGTLGGVLTIADTGVANLATNSTGTQTVNFASLTLTNYGTVVWSNLNIECQTTAIIDNYGLWDIQTNNTFYGAAGGDLTVFNNYGTVRKDGGSWSVQVLAPVTLFDNTVTFNNFGTIDVEIGGISLSTGNGSGGVFNTATNAGLSLGNFTLNGNSTFTGTGQVQGALYGYNGVVNGSLNLFAGVLSGTLTIASNSIINLFWPGHLPPVSLNGLTMTNYGTVIWGKFDLDCTSAQIYNHGLWDAQADNIFYGNAGGGLYMSTFNNYGTVRKDGGTAITHFDGATAFNNYGTVDVETAQINIDNGAGGGLFNTATNSIVWLGVPNGFGLSGNVTFTGPGRVGGNLVGGGASGGIIHGLLNFYYGSLGGSITVASNAVANLDGYGINEQLDLNYLSLTNCGTVFWNFIDLECSGTQIYNHGLWDAQTDNTFYGNAGGGIYTSTFSNYGTVRKDGGMYVTHFDSNTTFTNSGTVDVETAQINIDNGTGGGVFNTASNAIVWLGVPGGFDLSGNVTFTGPGLVGGNLLGYPNGGVIHGALNFYYGSLGGSLTVASNAVANLDGYGIDEQLDLNYLSLTNCGTVFWNFIDLECSGTQIYNHGLWDAQSDNTFYGNAGGSIYSSTFNNYGTVRKDGGMNVTHFDSATTFTNSGTVDVETGQINIDNGTGGGLFNTASNAIVWLGVPGGFDLSGSVTFSGPGLVGGNLLGYPNGAVIHGSLNFYFGSLGGSLTVASNAVANLDGLGFEMQPLDLNYLSLTNCGTVVWSNIDLDGSGTRIYNHGLWDAQSDNTFYGNAGGGLYTSTFNNSGTVRKDGGTSITHFDSATTFTNSGTVDVETAQINIDNGTGGGLFNIASNAIVWLGIPTGFDLSGNVTFTGPGLVGGNLLGFPNGGVIHGLLNFYYGSLGGSLTVASNAVANLDGFGFQMQPLDLNYLSLTNCGTINWSNNDLDCSSAQIYNHGLWDALSDNTFYGNAGGGLYTSTFNNCGTVRKDGGSGITTFDVSTTYNNHGRTDVQKGQVVLAGSCSLTNGTLNFGICGPSQFGAIDFPNFVQLAGRLSVNFTNHYTPAASNSFPVVAYGSESGAFSSLDLPALSSGLLWQTNYTSTAFTLSVAVISPLHLSAGLSASGNSMSLSWNGQLGLSYQVQCTTNLDPAVWVNLGNPVAGTNGPVTMTDSISASPQKYYRIQSQ